MTNFPRLRNDPTALTILAVVAGVIATSTPQIAAAQGYDEFFMMDGEVAIRRGNCIMRDRGRDGGLDTQQCYGYGNAESEYLVGDWDGNGVDNIAVRRGNCILKDTNFDGSHDEQQCFGNGDAEDQYLVGDWDGDGVDNIAVRRGNHILKDTDFDPEPEQEQYYGWGVDEDQYLVGDWDGDGVDNIAVRRGNCILQDTNGDNLADDQICIDGLADEYFASEWTAELWQSDVIATRSGNCFSVYEIDGPRTVCYGHEVCGTPIDENGNGFNNENCTEVCRNGVDDDGDGLDDNHDPDCIRPETCNFLDDDQNGLIDDLAECHSVRLDFSDIDDTARVWLGNASGPIICNVDGPGAYPRSGSCDLSAEMRARGNAGTGTFLVRFGNGGGGDCSGRMDVMIDGRPVSVAKQAKGWCHTRGWFLERTLNVNFRTGMLF